MIALVRIDRKQCYKIGEEDAPRRVALPWPISPQLLMWCCALCSVFIISLHQIDCVQIDPASHSPPWRSVRPFALRKGSRVSGEQIDSDAKIGREGHMHM